MNDQPMMPVADDVTSANDVTIGNDPTSANDSNQSEKLEDQNIFDLLGVKDGTEQDKEDFLDELQQVIWDDFLENDVEKILTADEMDHFRTLRDQEGGAKVEEQEKMIEYLSGLVPDLEEMMLEKALKLKQDLFKERIAGMREYHAGKSDALGVLDQSEQQMQDGLWRSAAQTLNSLT